MEIWFQRHLQAHNPHPFCQPKPVHQAADSPNLSQPKPFTYKTTRFQLTYSLCEYSRCFSLSSQPSLAPPPHTGFSSCACHKLQFLVDITSLLQLVENLVRRNLSDEKNNFFTESPFIGSIDATREIKYGQKLKIPPSLLFPFSLHVFLSPHEQYDVFFFLNPYSLIQTTFNKNGCFQTGPNRHLQSAILRVIFHYPQRVSRGKRGEYQTEKVTASVW